MHRDETWAAILGPARIALSVVLLSCGSPAVVPRAASHPPVQPAESQRPAAPATLPPVVTPKPSVLFASPTGTQAGNVDLQYLRELHEKGIEVDYTENLAELTWERIARYNVLVLTATPDAYAAALNFKPSSPEAIARFNALMDRFLESGGGLLLFPNDLNRIRQSLSDLTDRWGVRFPAEAIEEQDPDKRARMSRADIALAYTDRVLESPVTTGIRGVWYPCALSGLGASSTPIEVDQSWKVVVRASATAVTRPIDLHQTAVAAPNIVVRSEVEREPALVAIRELGSGRLAVVSQWQYFSFGAGTRWTYNREVLERGARGKPSDFGKLLENLLRWLAESSIQTRSLGGFSTPPERLLPTNQREAMKQKYRAVEPAYDPSSLDALAPVQGYRLYRGLIGAQTTHADGRSSVAEYAEAARRIGLDFVVFLDRFEALTRDEFATLTKECAEHSSDNLLLLPGFTIDANLGSRFFFFGPQPVWPPDKVLTGGQKQLLYVQEQAPDGRFTGYGTGYLDWVLSNYQGPETAQVGIYDFKHSPHGVSLPDARLYSGAALRFYARGKLVEDLLPDYLAAAQSSSPPTPFALSQVRSAAELARAAKAEALTYVQAASLDPAAYNGVFRAGLRWAHQYDAVPVFVSSGPQIVRWDGAHRVSTYGAEAFAPERALMRLNILLTSHAGLSEVRIYDGQRLYRRFATPGQHRFARQLLLDGAVQKNLILVALDRAGGRAVSAVVRSWADDSLAPVFCGDHINDCRRQPLLARSPFPMPLNYVPELPLDVGGAAWDGGPGGSLPLSNLQDTRARVTASGDVFDFGRASQLPLIEFADEGSVSVTSEAREPYRKDLIQVLTPWVTWGPIDREARWPVTSALHYREYVSPSLGPPESAWAALAMRSGTVASLFEGELGFGRAMTIQSIQLASIARHPEGRLAVSRGSEIDTFELARPERPTFTLERGRWFGLYSEKPHNAQLFWNRSEPLQIAVEDRIKLRAILERPTVAPKQRIAYEIAALGFPMDVPITDARGFQPYVDYVRDPTGLRVLRGRRTPSDGNLELAADASAVALALPRAAGVPGLTLPLRVSGLNPRWSAGLWQKQGYTLQFYGPSRDRYRGLGVEDSGHAYVPLHVDRADMTEVVAGHPVTADDAGRELSIQVTNLGGNPWRWHVAINNPTGRTIDAVLNAAMGLPGLEIHDKRVRVVPGGYLVLQ
ncbi:MAG TPA: hypothetical protein VJV78_34955 [Polyangiales bacterium]|nr:hypothetical protein [Polyangiales bacterium]